MIRKTTALLGAGVLVAGLAGPLTASAHAEDNALAFVLGAAVGQALDNDRHRVRHVHRPGVVPVHRGHVARHYRYAHPHAWRSYQRARWRHDYRHFQRHADGHHDRRWDKGRHHDRRWDDDRRGDRRGDRHGRHDGGRHDGRGRH
ncbi:MAG: hypothetical protein RIC56_13325 [Pseudomonadales bacterium]